MIFDITFEHEPNPLARQVGIRTYAETLHGGRVGTTLELSLWWGYLLVSWMTPWRNDHEHRRIEASEEIDRPAG